MTGRVLFYVQHLLGIGHVVRASRIANALCRSSFRVEIAFGGFPVRDIDWGDAHLTQLPPVSTGAAGFSDLVNESGAGLTDAFKASRSEQLITLLNDFQPDIVLIEAYPFARRGMRFELRPLIDAAHKHSPRPLIVSSIRDILQQGRKPERIMETTDLVRTFFDAVLVHGDENFAPLEESYPEAEKIAAKLHYTGLVGPVLDTAQAEDRADVIVSAGGGAVGAFLLKTAAQAMFKTSLATERWLFIAGPNLDAQAYSLLEKSLPKNARIERFRSDLPELLRTAKLSISQAGYNTVADILAAGCPSVLVPFATGGETEQTKRAQLLASAGRVAWISEAALSEDTLASAINAALSIDLSDIAQLPKADGARRSASILGGLLKNRRDN